MLMKDSIDKYFYKEFRYKEIIAFSENCHGIKICPSTLHRFLKRANFDKKGKQSPFLDIVTFIQHELEDSDSCMGYRGMHERCIRNDLMLSRVIVAQIMKHLDPIGVNKRRRGPLKRRLYYTQGQNWVWHFNGYDKMKPYGFEIQGCIDGYSRRVL